MAHPWKDKRVLVTGGAGFLGSHLCESLRQAGAVVFVPRSADYDLRKEDDAIRMFCDHPHIDYLFHLAATVGGIGANRKSPGSFIYDNLAMNLNVLEQGRQPRFNVGKLVFVGSVCQYPKFTPAPFRETDLWNGYPEETNAPYGISKRTLLAMMQAYRQQYGTNAIFVIPTNLYGPGDNFDLDTSHVIPALIRKFASGVDPVAVWGTGNPSRDFLHVGDAAKALMLAAQRYDKDGPVNLGSGVETTIADLVDMIVDLTGYTGRVVWNPSMPDGQPRRVLDTSRAWERFGWRATTGLEGGLRETIEWWKNSERME